MKNRPKSVTLIPRPGGTAYPILRAAPPCFIKEEGSPMRLLFAEDQPQLRRSVTKALTAAGYSVDAAADGA